MSSTYRIFQLVGIYGLAKRAVGTKYFNYELNDNGTVRHYGFSHSDYYTDILSDEVIKFIRNQSLTQQPFFILFAPSAPHQEVYAGDSRLQIRSPVPAPRHQGVFSSETLPKLPNFNELDVSDKPSFLRDIDLMNSTDILFVEELYRKRMETLLAVDESVCRIIDTLSDSGKLENTIIIYTSDNGFFHGEHRLREGKRLHYEPSSRVPLVIRGPGIPKNETKSELVSNVDITATIIDFAKAKPYRTQDGKSIMLLVNGATGWRNGLLIECSIDRVAYRATRMSKYEAIRTDRYVYAELPRSRMKMNVN